MLTISVKAAVLNYFMIIPQRYSAAIRYLLPSILLLVGTVISMAAPANDNFASAQQLVFGEIQEIRTETQGATKEEGEPLHAQSTGGVSVWYKFTVATNGFITISTAGSLTADGWPMDTILVVYAGPSLTQLNRVGGNDDDPQGDTMTSKAIIPVEKDVTYYVAVDCYTAVDTGTLNLSYSFSNEYPTWRAPSWEAESTSNSWIRSGDFTGKVILVNFWATWCAPCIEEVPALISLHEQYKDSGFTVVGISTDNFAEPYLPIELVENFRQEYGITYPVGVEAPIFSVSKAFGQIDGIPTSFIIDRENNIIQKFVGARTKEQFEEFIKPLLGSSISLKIEERGEKIRLWWKTDPKRIIPQFSLTATPSSWTDLPQINIEVTGETSSIELDRNDGAKFFRLKVE